MVLGLLRDERKKPRRVGRCGQEVFAHHYSGCVAPGGRGSIWDALGDRLDVGTQHSSKLLYCPDDEVGGNFV